MLWCICNCWCCCSAVPVGKVSLPAEGLVENVCLAMRGVIHYIPRGWKNIQSVHIKSVDSIALPIFNSLPLAPAKVALDKTVAPVKIVQQVEVSLYTLWSCFFLLELWGLYIRSSCRYV